MLGHELYKMLRLALTLAKQGENEMAQAVVDVALDLTRMMAVEGGLNALNGEDDDLER